MGETVGAALILIVMIAAGLSLKRLTKKDEFKDLMASGQPITLNLFSLLIGFFRRKDDPLREAHIKIAKIGIMHFVLMFVGIFAVFLVGGIATAVFRE